jgi:hypothetical protein
MCYNNSVGKDLDDLKRRIDKLKDKVPLGTFSFSEQELIRRIIKSVLPQMKSIDDKQTAQDILDKTRWLDE